MAEFLVMTRQLVLLLPLRSMRVVAVQAPAELVHLVHWTGVARTS